MLSEISLRGTPSDHASFLFFFQIYKRTRVAFYVTNYNVIFFILFYDTIKGFVDDLRCLNLICLSLVNLFQKYAVKV